MTTDEDQLRAWMTGGLDGDATSHAMLLRALVPLLRRYFRRRLSAAGEIEDLVQETLIAVHTRRASYDRGRAFMPWLFAIARYKLVDHFRRIPATIPIEGLGEVLAIEGFEAESSAALDVTRLLDTLPPASPAAIRRTRIDGLSTAEAAKAAGIGESDVKVSVHRGIKALMARLQGDRP